MAAVDGEVTVERLTRQSRHGVSSAMTSSGQVGRVPSQLERTAAQAVLG